MGKYTKVFDRQNRRVRGLWFHTGTRAYYAQICLDGSPVAQRVKLEADTVPAAVTEMGALKKKREDGELLVEKKRGVPRFIQMADDYLETISKLEKKHPDTIKRETASLKALKLYFRRAGDKHINEITMADATAYAKWRKDHPLRKNMETVSGRIIDLDIIVLRHIMNHARELGHVRANPIGEWNALAEAPKEVRLLSTEEVNRMFETAYKEVKGGKTFGNFLRVLACSGGRYRETLRLRWSVNVDWANRRLGFGQDGLSKYQKKRWVQFNPQLEAVLKEMDAERNRECDWLFPSYYHPGTPIKCYKGALETVKEFCNIDGRLGFHHFRHYFISVCCMSGIDLTTIRDWVGHEDLQLIARIYSHLSDEHKIGQAAKVNFATAKSQGSEKLGAAVPQNP